MISLYVANMCCGGRGNTITRRLLTIPSVRTVAVDIEHQTVTLNATPDAAKAAAAVLQSLDYPQAGNDAHSNGLGARFKSVVSCVVGRSDGRSGTGS